MTTTVFDTLKYANTLKAAGMPDKQAEAQASILAEVFAVNFKELATKDDLATTRDELTAMIRESEQRLNAKIDSVDQRLNATMDSVDQRLNGAMDSVDQRLSGKIDNVDQRLSGKIDNVDQRLSGKIDSFAARMEGQMALVKWMIGLSISLNVAVLVRLFFVR